jgi:hypothetical protein
MRQSFRRAPERNGVDPGDRVRGYYLVRAGEKWRVVRWMPKANRWEIGASQTWPARYWDEIGDKVA